MAMGQNYPRAKPLEIFPYANRWNVLQGWGKTAGLTLYSEEKAPLSVIRVECPVHWITVKTVLSAPDERSSLGRPGQNQYTLHVTVDGRNAPLGPFAQRVKVITNSQIQPELEIPVTGAIRPNVSHAPSSIDF